MHEPFATDKALCQNLNEIELDVLRLSAQLEANLRKILSPYGKNLITYLQCAQYPTNYGTSADDSKLLDMSQDLKKPGKLFTEEEIVRFLTYGALPPLEKLVVLAGVMNRTLILTFKGYRNAQIPLVYSDNPEHFMHQVRLNIYGLLSLLAHGFAKPKRKLLSYSAKSTALSPAAHPHQSITDCGAIESILQCSRYYGYRLDLFIRHRAN